MNPAERTLTIAEAARMTGLSRKAMARRIERGTLRAFLGPDQLRHIPFSELVGTGLVDEQGRAIDIPAPAPQLPGAAPGLWGTPPAGYPDPERGPSPTRRAAAPMDATALLSRLERLAAENDRLRGLQSRYDELERDLAAEREMRARIESELMTLWTETEGRKRPWNRRRPSPSQSGRDEST